jgi:hypothetical protein
MEKNCFFMKLKIIFIEYSHYFSQILQIKNFNSEILLQFLYLSN